MEPLLSQVPVHVAILILSYLFPLKLLGQLTISIKNFPPHQAPLPLLALYFYALTDDRLSSQCTTNESGRCWYEVDFTILRVKSL
jgi:hypothetical protein